MSVVDLITLLEEFSTKATWSADVTHGGFWLHATCLAVSRLNLRFESIAVLSDAELLHKALEVNELLLAELAAIGPFVLAEAEVSSAVESGRSWFSMICSHCLQVLIIRL